MRTARLNIRLIALRAWMSVAVCGACAAPAAGFTVTNLNDHGPGSLREAVTLADAAPGGDTIDFQAGLTGTIGLTTGIININGDLVITGPGAAGLAVSGNHASGVFAVAAGCILTITDLSIINGSRNYGGGILSGGTLNVDRCLFSGNEGSVAFNGGGGICSLNGALTVTNSTFLDNRHALMGGGVYAANGVSTLINCTFVGNSVDLNGLGGALANYATSRASMHLVNCTFRDNLTAGTNNQFLNCAASGTAHADYVNTIFAGYAPAGANITSISSGGVATVTSLGHNISTDSTGQLTASGDQAIADPMLGVLSDNGGPTPTCSLLPGSPAIDAGSNSGAPETDQRGLPRIQDGNNDGLAICDMGAVEMPTTLALQLITAVSRKTHGAQGDFDIALGGSGVEGRLHGPELIIAGFNQPVLRVTNTLADVSLSSGSIASLNVSGSVLTINLSGVINGQPLIVTFPGIKGIATPVSPATTCIPVLYGDANISRSTNILDVVSIRNSLHTVAASNNFTADVNTDGSINIFDMVTVRNVLNQSVTPCP